MQFNQGRGPLAKDNGVSLLGRAPGSEKHGFSIYVLGLICVIGWTRASLGQQVNPEASTVAGFSGFLAYVPQALKVGTAITAMIGLVKAISEWTASGRTKRDLEKAIRLAAFTEALTKMASGQTKPEYSSELLEHAQREFILAADRCYRPKALPSRIRRAFLIYLPPRLVAYIPHFLFFTLCALAVSAAIGIGGDVFNKTGDASDLFVFPLIGVFALFMQQWAALEWRKSQKILLSPRPLIGEISRFPANSLLGLIANSLLILHCVFLLIAFVAPSSFNRPATVSVWPLWQQIMLTLVGCVSIPVMYLWGRAEYLYCSGEIVSLSLREIADRAVNSKTLESRIGLTAITVLTFWCSVLLIDLRFVQKIAAFPDGTVGTVGIAVGCFVVVMLFFLYGAIPWIAVYRGLSDLLDHGRVPAPEVKCD